MNNLALNNLNIKTKEVLVDNGKDGYWYRSWYENKYGLADNNGNWVVEPIFADIFESENIFIAIYKSKQGKRIFFFNNNGKLAFETQFNIIEAKEFKNGFCLVQVADILDINRSVPWTYVINLCKWGLIDNKGIFIAKPKFDFENQVEIDNKNLLINYIKQNGCEILTYANSDLMVNKHNLKDFKKAIKYYLIKDYIKNSDINKFKENCKQQNELFKQIIKKKIRENFSNLKADKSVYELEK